MDAVFQRHDGCGSFDFLLKLIYKNPMSSFLGLIHKEEKSSYGICFPDVLGCISIGDTFEEALANGREALQFHLEMMVEDGNDLPHPRSYEKLLQDKEAMELAEGAIWVFVENIPIKKAA